MISKEEVRELLHSTETYRLERTTSTGDMDKFQEAICAFSNDLPNSKKKGYLIIGTYDNGTLSGLKVDDNLLHNRLFYPVPADGKKESSHLSFPPCKACKPLPPWDTAYPP